MRKSTDAFLQFLDAFYSGLEDFPAGNVLTSPEKAAIISVDVTNAFCRSGNLASQRVARIIDPIINLFDLAWEIGLREFVLLNDCHSTDAEEFNEFAPHAICGSFESEAVDELKALKYFPSFKIIKKNSINPAHGTEFDEWIRRNPSIHTFIVVGDCTDLCVYQTAMHLITSANAMDIDRRVVLPENCVETYDLPIDAAIKLGAEPHAGDFLHRLFLYHMHLNGVEIYKKLK